MFSTSVVRLITTYNFEIEHLPDNLKCAKCKMVLKDACLVPCGCTYCRICIDEIMKGGGEFCPGLSEECRESVLSSFLSDYRANNSISKLTVKCPQKGCLHVCKLAHMEDHLRECQKNHGECPFRELGCKQDSLAAKEMEEHLQQDNRIHSGILIGMIVNINNEVQLLKHELVLKDEQIKTIMDQMNHLVNENKSIAKEKEDLVDQVRVLSEKIETEIDERRESNDLYSARMIEHVGKNIFTITRVIESNKDELAVGIMSVREDIQSINQSAQSIQSDIGSMRLQMQSLQAISGMGQVDARYELSVDEDVRKTTWRDKTSDNFTGSVHPYKYRLALWNCIYSNVDSLIVHLRICRDPNDGKLVWPFEARVVITVADQNRRETCRTISRQCRIDRPRNSDSKSSDPFEFLHSELIATGLDLSVGVHVSCLILPGAGR